MKAANTPQIAAALTCLAEAVGAANVVDHTDQVARNAIAAVKAHCQSMGFELNVDIEGHLGTGVKPQIHAVLVENLGRAAKFLKEAPLPPSLLEKADWILKGLVAEGPNDFDAVAAHTRLLDYSMDLLKELQAPKFLCISAEHRELYEQKEPPFGQLVADKFPDSARDISAAARCLALDEWTACVSHLMRALESPLKIFADRVGVTFPAPTELENWKSIVDQMASKIEAEVKRLEQTKKTHERNKELELLGEIALDFRHFKNAWRNGVSHGRDWYDERDADTVFRAVKQFMRRMADGV